MTHGSLFSGIGGFDLAAEWMGWENVFHCEWNKECKKILKYYWPNAESYDDITKTDFTIHRGRIDILTGGFPCQPFSISGKRKGKQDERYLWPNMLRAISEIKPVYIVGENVPEILNTEQGMVFEQICSSLEAEGYQVQPLHIPASGIGAFHRRERIWFVAYSEQNASSSRANDNKKQGTYLSNVPKNFLRKEECVNTGFDHLYADIFESRAFKSPSDISKLKSKPLIFRTDDGFPGGVDKNSEEQLGNAIVPQVAYEIFKAIEKCDNL